MELFSIGVFCQVCPLAVLGINPVCVWETFTFITCLCPKRLTISTFVIRKKPHVSHITLSLIVNLSFYKFQKYLHNHAIILFWGGGRPVMQCRVEVMSHLTDRTNRLSKARQAELNISS